MSRRLCIEAKSGYVISTITASYKYLAVVHESQKQFTANMSSKESHNYYIECYEIDDSYNLRKINNMYKITVNNTENLDAIDITGFIDDDSLYLFSNLMYDYVYVRAELAGVFKISDNVIHSVGNSLTVSEVKKLVDENTKAHSVYSVMDHECKYYNVNYEHGNYRNHLEPFAMSNIQLTSKQSNFMAGKFNKSAHANPGIREFTIHDATHITQVIMRGEFTGLGTHGRKLEVYPAFIADSQGNIHLTYLRPDTKRDITSWNLYHLVGQKLNGFPSELLDVIAEYC